MEGERAARETRRDDKDRAGGEGSDGGDAQGHTRLRVGKTEAALMDTGEVREEALRAGVPIAAAWAGGDAEVGVAVGGVG